MIRVLYVALFCLLSLKTLAGVSPRTIGVILPLTGKYANISQKTLRGIQLGLGIDGVSHSPYKLAIVDSEGNSDIARRGVDRLIYEDNVIAIISSPLSKTALATAKRAQELGVPVIDLSQKVGITDVGNYIFRNAVTTEMQVRKLVHTAMNELSLKKFAILYPNDAYGVEFANLFWDEVLARGGQITSAQTYSPKETDFRGPIQRLIGTYYIESRLEEFRFRKNELARQNSKKSSRTSDDESILPPITDFDAIFIPDTAKTLGQIAAMLSYNDVKNIHLLGTNLWNLPGIDKRAGLFSSEILFVDAINKQDPEFLATNFASEYKDFFNETPGLFETQGYDSAKLLSSLINSGADDREELLSKLNNKPKYAGSMGNLTINYAREINIPLISYTILDGEITRLDQIAPKEIKK